MASWEYVYTADEDNGGLKAIMYHNGESSTFTVKENGVEKEVTVAGANQTLHITKNDEDKLRLVVCTGNVEIEDGVHFKGIIMAKGTLTLGIGATLESSPLEAAKVFQAQISSLEEMGRVPRLRISSGTAINTFLETLHPSSAGN